MKRVLVLRPEPGASATVKRARERGLEAIAIPLFEIETVAWDVPEAAGSTACSSPVPTLFGTAARA